MSSSCGDRLSGIIDFYFACTDFYAYDLAVCLNAWCFEPNNCLQRHQGAGLHRQLPQDRGPCRRPRYAALPLLARGSALRFLLTRLYDWLNHPPGAFVKPKDPLEYLRKLRFHAAVSSPGGYGLDPPPLGLGWHLSARAGETQHRHLHRRGLQRQSGAGRLGRHPALGRP